MKEDEEKDDTTRLGVNDEVSPERAPLASLMVDEEEPSDSADMEVESAIAAIAAAAGKWAMLANAATIRMD